MGREVCALKKDAVEAQNSIIYPVGTNYLGLHPPETSSVQTSQYFARTIGLSLWMARLRPRPAMDNLTWIRIKKTWTRGSRRYQGVVGRVIIAEIVQRFIHCMHIHSLLLYSKACILFSSPDRIVNKRDISAAKPVPMCTSSPNTSPDVWLPIWSLIETCLIGLHMS